MAAPRRARAGVRPDLGPIRYRSAWEANMARLFNRWIGEGKLERAEYEEKKYKFPVERTFARAYVPDYHLYYPDGSVEVWEVKGVMDAASRVKLARMAKYYPDIVVVLVDSDRYRQYEREYAHLIPEWEASRVPREEEPDDGTRWQLIG